MKRIAILSSSVRNGRLSHRVALFLKRFWEERFLAESEVLDLKAYRFPLFEERLVYQPHPSELLLDFTERLNSADGLVIVSPVYNASFPAALKNVIDLYFAEWARRPVGVVSVTSGKAPGIATVQEVQVLMLKLGAFVVPKLSTVTEVEANFSPEGEALDRTAAERMLLPMMEELDWMVGICKK